MSIFGQSIRNLSRKKVFYFGCFISLLGFVCGLAYPFPAEADTCQCVSDPQTGDGPDRICTWSTTSFIYGNPDAQLTITGCHLDDPGPDQSYKLKLPKHGLEIEGIVVDWVAGGLVLSFDLTDAYIGYYDFELGYAYYEGDPPKRNPSSGLTYKTFPNKILVYSPSIVGWGWFGATTSGGTEATPGWLSLNCQSETVPGYPDGTCYDADDNPAGTDYGFGLYYSTDHYDIRGQSWLGVYDDSDANPANNTATGWITADPANPPNYPGFTDGKAQYFEETGKVTGWARIATLQDYGGNLYCQDPLTRSWGGTTITGSNGGIEPRLAEGRDGTRHILFEANNKIQYSQLTETGWSTPFDLPAPLGPQVNSSDSDIGIEADGTVHATFIDSNQLVHSYCVSKCTEADNWLSELVNVGASPESQSLKAAGTTLHVAYEDGNDIYYTWREGGAWQPAEQVSTNPRTASNPGLARDFNGGIHVVWQDTRDGSDIYYRYRDNATGSWEDEYQASEADSNVNPDIAVDPDGNPHVAYESNRAGQNHIYYRKHTEVSGWYPEAAVAEDMADSRPSIAVGNDYQIHVLYQDDSAADSKIKYRESQNGYDWSEASEVSAAAGDQLWPDAVASRSNRVQAVYQSATAIEHVSSSSLSCQNPDPVLGADWGWVSLRGVDLTDPERQALGIDGAFRSCYDCDWTAKTCKICEVDDNGVYGDPPDPPLYACNSCSTCGVCSNVEHNITCFDNSSCQADDTCIPYKKCRRTGEDCTDNPAVCDYLPGQSNECAAVCASCNTCSLWGVSIEGPITTEGIFHGYGWSGGGTIPVSAGNPAGSYDSGNVQIEGDISDSDPDIDPDCLTGRCFCDDRVICESWGWLTDGGETLTSNNQYCANKQVFIDGNEPEPDQWGACSLQLGANPIYFTKLLSDLAPTQNIIPGNYYLSISALYDEVDTENPKVTVINDSSEQVLEGFNFQPDDPAIIKCTFDQQVYLTPDTQIKFEQGSPDQMFLDTFRITSLPAEPLDCLTGQPFTQTYVDEVGFGFVDFSEVSLIAPWVETWYGDIYSKGTIGPGGAPPGGSAYSSTYIIETPSGATIIDWTSFEGLVREGVATEFDLPDPSSLYRNGLGRIPYEEMIKFPANQFTDRVVEFNSSEGGAKKCDDGRNMNWSNIKQFIMPGGQPYLEKGIYHFGKKDEYCSLTINEDVVFENADQGHFGNGTFVIEGDLIIDAKIEYGGDPIQTISQLASVGFIVKGDVVINPSVTKIVGGYAVIGCDPDTDGPGPDVGNCPPGPNHPGAFKTGVGGEQLRIDGVVLARQYQLERQYASATEGAEVFVNNGVLHANPPPGFVDIAKSIPQITAIKPF